MEDDFEFVDAERTSIQARVVNGTRDPGPLVPGKPKSITARHKECGTTARFRESRNLEPGTFQLAMFGHARLVCPGPGCGKQGSLNIASFL